MTNTLASAGESPVTRIPYELNVGSTLCVVVACVFDVVEVCAVVDVLLCVPFCAVVDVLLCVPLCAVVDAPLCVPFCAVVDVSLPSAETVTTADGAAIDINIAANIQ
jgi:hypothetical protein